MGVPSRHTWHSWMGTAAKNLVGRASSHVPERMRRFPDHGYREGRSKSSAGSLPRQCHLFMSQKNGHLGGTRLSYQQPRSGSPKGRTRWPVLRCLATWHQIDPKKGDRGIAAHLKERPPDLAATQCRQQQYQPQPVTQDRPGESSGWGHDDSTERNVRGPKESGGLAAGGSLKQALIQRAGGQQLRVGSIRDDATMIHDNHSCDKVEQAL